MLIELADYRQQACRLPRMGWRDAWLEIVSLAVAGGGYKGGLLQRLLAARVCGLGSAICVATWQALF